MILKYSTCVLLLMLIVHLQVFSIEITKTTCEMLESPVGISTSKPRLGWQLGSALAGDRQTACQVLVSSDKASLAGETGSDWNSGKVSSSQSQFIPYEGKALKSATRYYWKVRVWDVNGKPSAWSEINYWEMAPDLSTSGVKWIGAITHRDSHLPEGRKFASPNKDVRALWEQADPLAKRSIILRKPVSISKKIEKATVYISGLGQYEMTINGKKVGASEFAPLWSDYDKTVYYNIYNVNDLLQQGNNVLGVMLGNGFYNVSGNRYLKLLGSFGPPTLFMRMTVTYTDGSQEVITTDESWKYAGSPITFNCIYGGEDYDANLEQPGWDRPGFDDKTWKPVVIQEAPQGVLRPQLAAPVKIMQTYTIKSTTEPAPGVHVLNMGQNLSGFPAIKVQGRKGQKVKLIVGESLSDNGTVSQKRTGGPYYLEYTLKGEGVEEWHPRFSYYGFQYIQVEGVDLKTATTGDKPVLLEVTSNFIYNSSGESGTFECSNQIFNQAHNLIDKAVKSNWQSVLTDCPHREKLGWLEETHLNGPGLLYNYDLKQYIPKIMRDMADSQRGGMIPSISPEYVIFGGDFTDSPEWGGAVVILPWMYYEYYGDSTLITQYYDVMRKYVDYMTSRADHYILSYGLGDWYDYGDHPAGYAKNSPIALSATGHYYYAALLVNKAAEMTGRKDDVAKYTALCRDIKDAFNSRFFHADTKQYATGSQYSNALPLFLDMVDPQYKQAVLDNLVADIRQHGTRLTTGDVGNRYLYQVLARNGRNDVMYEMHNHSDVPGYGFQIRFGLTTLTEQWDPRKGNSWNHFMMGQIEEWFYYSLAGIIPDMKHPGFSHFTLQPEPVGDLTYVKATYNTLYGDIKVDWKKESGVFTLTIIIPVNTTATINLPLGTLMTVNNTSAKKVKSIKQIKTKTGHAQIVAGGGTYTFVVKSY